MRVTLTLLFAIAVFGASTAHAAEVRSGTLYKNPNCGCCEQYAAYLEQNGFDIAIEPITDLSTIKSMAGVPEQLEACHTLMIDGYTVEGHVPVNTLERLLTEEPEIKGIALPGMPMGSPGMGGEKTQPFTIFEIATGTPQVYAVE